MDTYDIIYNKREGQQLSRSEIKYLIEGYATGDIPDYQLSAWAMAVFFQGLSREETTYLTEVMVDSGEKISLALEGEVVVDKHSTGGVGDTTTLVLVPLVSSAGLPVAKMSGRGLGHTGGTIDKLESIPGFEVELSRAEFEARVRETGAAVVAQTSRLAPADKKLYALRDVTATVDSIPLIASSIMSKKIAGGAEAIVLDVKTGSGAFMKDKKQALALANTMVDIGRKMGRGTAAVLTNMNQPLGYAVGNSLEVIEALETLKGQGPKDLEELCLTLGARMLFLGNKVASLKEGSRLLEQKIASGEALQKIKEIIAAQQGNPDIINDYSLLPTAECKLEIKSDKSGYISEVDSLAIGRLSVQLGAGRSKKGADIDHGAGIILKKKIGDRVNKGDILARIYFNKRIVENKIAEKQLQQTLLKAFTIADKRPKSTSLILETIG